MSKFFKYRVIISDEANDVVPKRELDIYILFMTIDVYIDVIMLMNMNKILRKFSKQKNYKFQIYLHK